MQKNEKITTEQTYAPKHKGAKRRSLKTRKVLITIVSVLLVLAVGGYALFYYYFEPLLNPGNIIDEGSVGVHKVPEVDDEITNVALFGVDSRDGDRFSGNSDTVIIVSINSTTNSVKMISILRDSLVNIPGRRADKLNAAYAYGGATLAIKTLNTNFKLDITDYATINFAYLAGIIDALGGVVVNIDYEEMLLINVMLPVEGYTGKVDNYGEVLLTGPQAMMFARIRKHSDNMGDTGRSMRQREVLEAMLTKFLTLPKTQMPEFMRAVLQQVETSMSFDDVIKFLPVALSDNLTLEQKIIPGADTIADYWGGGNPWAWHYDINEAASFIRNYIYDTSEIADDIISER